MNERGVTREQHWRAEVGPDVTVEIRSELFGISITKGEDNEVKLDAVFEFQNVDDNAEVEVPISCEWNESQNEVRIDISPDWEVNPHRHNIRVNSHIELHIPTNCHLTAETENGGLTVKDLYGEFNLKTENAGMRVEQCSGEMELESENGGIRVVNCSGELKLHQENGAVEVLGSSFDNADVENENGRIVFAFDDQKSGRFTFRNENGKTLLMIPEAIEYNLTAGTENGPIHIGLEGNYSTAHEGDRRIVTMARGSGKVRIEVESENGGITLVSRLVDGDDAQRVRFEHNHHFHHEHGRHFVHGKMDKESIREFKEQMKQLGAQMKELAMDKEANHDELRRLGREMGRLGAELGRSLQGVGAFVGEVVEEGLKDFGMGDFLDGVFERSGRSRSPKAPVAPVDPVEPIDPDAPEPVEPLDPDDSTNIRGSFSDNQQEKMQILEMLRDGKVTVDEAERLLKALD